MKTPVYAMRVATCKKLGINRVSFLRGRRRVGAPIYVDENTSQQQALKLWLSMNRNGCGLRSALKFVKTYRRGLQLGYKTNE